MLQDICLLDQNGIALYLDERANNDQKDALTKIFRGQAGGEFFGEILPLIGEILGIKSVSIELALKVRRDVG